MPHSEKWGQSMNSLQERQQTTFKFDYITLLEP